MIIKDYLFGVYESLNFELELNSQHSAKENPIEFIELILGMKPAPHHYPWIDAIIAGDNAVLNKVSGEFLRISAPRGSAKTTIISVLLSWIIGHNPHIRIILCSYSEEVALTISVAIKLIIDSENYQKVFPKIKRSSRWRDKSWFIDRTYAGLNYPLKDPTLLAVGASGAIASRRADLIVLDDPIKSGKDIANPSIRADQVRWWSEVLSPTLVPQGRALVLCTRYRVDDIHGTLFTAENNWNVINQQAIIKNEDGEEESYWEDYMPLSFLRQKREEDPVAFASQYQNQPMIEENQVIKPEWILVGAVPGKFEKIAVGLDLAASKKDTAHYSAYTVSGVSSGKYYVLKNKRGRWTLNDTIIELLNVYRDFAKITNRFSFQIESVAYQVAFVSEFKRRCLELNLRMLIEEVKLKGDKLTRLYGISGLFENQLIIFNELADLSILKDEILNFGVCAFDDCVDSMVHSLNKIYNSRGKLSSGVY